MCNDCATVVLLKNKYIRELEAENNRLKKELDEVNSAWSATIEDCTKWKKLYYAEVESNGREVFTISN